MAAGWSLGLVLSLTSWLGLVACGGHSRKGGGDDEIPQSGGSSGVGGSGTSGGSATERKDCSLDGEVYADGSIFSNGCNDCSCQDGDVTCNARDCDDGCTQGGRHYSAGEVFLAGDDCNTCTCAPGGSVTCTMKQCPSCGGAARAYADEVQAARKCDPLATGQCQATLPAEARCSCDVFVNGSNQRAIAAAKDAAALFDLGDCDRGSCTTCDAPGIGYCAAEGLCAAIREDEPRPCKVGGIVYPSGASFPDLTSCNRCSCEDGQLSCTAVYCPLSECPPGRIEGTQCAVCSSTHECLLTEYECLPTCDASGGPCKEGSCSDGVCVKRCG
jgi:hypothetical protein